jgi:hypothetical protein
MVKATEFEVQQACPSSWNAASLPGLPLEERVCGGGYYTACSVDICQDRCAGPRACARLADQTKSRPNHRCLPGVLQPSGDALGHVTHAGCQKL